MSEVAEVVNAEIVTPKKYSEVTLIKNIRAGLTKTLDGIFQAGKWLTIAKKTLNLNHVATLNGNRWETWLKDNFGISQPYASKLMNIYETLEPYSHANKDTLPRDSEVLYQLTRVEDDALRLEIESPAGIVRPGMSRAEAHDLAERNPKPGARRPRAAKGHRLPVVVNNGSEVNEPDDSGEWYTPEEIIELARETLGTIELDPASSDKANETVKATEYFTREQNGLTKEWHDTVWLNPPWNEGTLRQWASKLLQSYRDKQVTAALMLLPQGVLTSKWFEPFHAYPFLITTERINFIRPSGMRANSPVQGCVIVYLGPDIDTFRKAFALWGRVVDPSSGVVAEPVNTIALLPGKWNDAAMVDIILTLRNHMTAKEWKTFTTIALQPKITEIGNPPG